MPTIRGEAYCPGDSFSTGGLLRLPIGAYELVNCPTIGLTAVGLYYLADQGSDSTAGIDILR